MATTKKLWLKVTDIPTLTSVGGNIDTDSLLPHVYTAQTTELKRILGLSLYKYIDDKIQTGTDLTGDYLEIFEEYIIDMLVYYSAMCFMPFAGTKTTSAGVFKQTAENGQTVDAKEIQRLTDNYRQLAVGVENSFYDYIKTKNIAEYPTSTDDGQGNVVGWF